MNKKYLFISIILILVAFVAGSLFSDWKSNNTTKEEATTILKSVENISKLMVVEGHFSEIYNYKDEQKIFFDILPIEKKALIVVNAKVLVGYDLRQMKVDIDQAHRKVIIQSIPSPEVNIIPDIKYYDVQSSTFSEFTAEDINKVQAGAKAQLEKAVAKSGLKETAHERLIETLTNIQSLSGAMGWQVIDQTKTLKIDG